MLTDTIKQNVQNVIDHLKEVDQSKFNMCYVTIPDEQNVCSSPACIAGYTDFVAKGKPADWFKTFLKEGETLESTKNTLENTITQQCMDYKGNAAAYLGLTDGYDAEEGAYLTNIMFNNELLYNKATISDAITMLEHYRDTGDVVWNIK